MRSQARNGVLAIRIHIYIFRIDHTFNPSNTIWGSAVLERFPDSYVPLWNFLGMLAFLASMLLWTWALRKPPTEKRLKETLLPSGVYQTLAPQFNLRLRLLNEQLAQFWKTEATRN